VLFLAKEIEKALADIGARHWREQISALCSGGL
jgi:hypothetical protein